MASEATRSAWASGIDPALPCWADHIDLLTHLDGPGFPGCAALNALLPPGLGHAGQPPVRFVSSEDHDPGPYEQRIFDQGQVSTRPESWHDLFNALTWALLPQTKLAMNGLHCSTRPDHGKTERGPLRDALTLFDECGLIVASTDRNWLEGLARHDWESCLLERADFFREQVTLIVAGHALLEKFLAPYPSMTGNALLVHIGEDIQALPRHQRIARLDEALSSAMVRDSIPRKPADLSPLPMMGLPGWWPGLRQDLTFYSDRSIFRPLRPGKAPGSVFALG